MPGGTGERTEKPTPRRLQQAREEGQVARSQELANAFTLLASFLTLSIIFENIIDSMARQMRASFSLSSIPELTIESVFTLLMERLFNMASLLAPLLLATALVGLLIGFLQVGFLFLPKLMLPKLSRINPLSGFKRLFSLRSLLELAKSMAKISVIALISYFQLRSAWPLLLITIQQGLEPALLLIVKTISRVAVSILTFLVVLGVADFAYQKYEHMKSLRMTKYEVKQEYKEQEGDPQIKSKRRQKQLQMSLNRMIKALQEADVVITNPTHIAVALKYDIDTMDAPVVVAKGEGYMALRIIEKAREFGIEIVENKPLARALNSSSEIGQEIPVDLYQAVAEVLAFVYRTNGRF